jgi:elongation factor P--(R)-beta-lysine ligase
MTDMDGRDQAAASIQTLRDRSQLLGKVRSFLESRGYWEVETPLLSRDVCVDEHIEPFRLVEGSERFYLQTSPEFHMKRLLASGSGSIFQITRSFRKEESGPLHNPEFTIIEWYRVGGTYGDLMSEIAELLDVVTNMPRAERLTYRDAFRRHAAIDPFKASDEALTQLAREEGFVGDTDRDGLLNFLLATLVELKLIAPTFIYDYPASQSALARVREDGAHAVAERFELYIQGIEICNGFQELTDAAALRKRNRERNDKRHSIGLERLPEDSRLLDAMDRGLPASTGVALGFDRLCMLVVGKDSIQEVIAFPFDRC